MDKQKNLSVATQVKYKKAISTFNEFSKTGVTFAQLTNKLIDDFNMSKTKKSTLDRALSDAFRLTTMYLETMKPVVVASCYMS